MAGMLLIGLVVHGIEHWWAINLGADPRLPEIWTRYCAWIGRD